MEEVPAPEVKKVGNPRRYHSGHDSRAWSKAVYAGDIVSSVFEAGEFLVLPKGFSGTWGTLGNFRELVVMETRTLAEEASKP